VLADGKGEEHQPTLSAEYDTFCHLLVVVVVVVVVTGFST